MVDRGFPVMAPSGYVARVDEEACEGCGDCQEACPFRAVHVNGTAVVSWEACMGCGVCVQKCPNKAVSLERDEGKGMPLDVRLLAPRRAE